MGISKIMQEHHLDNKIKEKAYNLETSWRNISKGKVTKPALKTLQRLIFIEGSYIEVSRTKIILHGINTSEYNSSVIGIIYNTKETHQYLEKMSEMKLFKRKWFEYLKLITEISIEHQRVTK